MAKTLPRNSKRPPLKMRRVRLCLSVTADTSSSLSHLSERYAISRSQIVDHAVALYCKNPSLYDQSNNAFR